MSADACRPRSRGARWRARRVAGVVAFAWCVASVASGGCRPNGPRVSTDAGVDAPVAPYCDPRAEALVARAANLARRVVASSAFRVCLQFKANQYVPCLGDPLATASQESQTVGLFAASQFLGRAFDTNACRDGILALPESLDPIERQAWIHLVYETTAELDLPPCIGDYPWYEGCRRPYPHPLAGLASRIVHHHLHAAGYGHGVPDSAHDCGISAVDHDRNGRIDDCVIGDERPMALYDADGDELYDADDPYEVAITRVRLACGLTEDDPPYFLVDAPATSVVEQCVAQVLWDSDFTCENPEPDGDEGYIERACGDDGVLLVADFTKQSCICFPGAGDALVAVQRTSALETLATATHSVGAWTIDPSTRVVAVGDLLTHASDPSPIDEIVIRDDRGIRVVVVAADGKFESRAELPFGAKRDGRTFDASLDVVGALDVLANGEDVLIVQRALVDGEGRELLALDVRDDFRVRASWTSSEVIDREQLQRNHVDALIGDVSAAAGEELVFENGDTLLVVGVDTSSATWGFRVRGAAVGGGFGRSGFYLEQDRVVGLVDPEGDGLRSILAISVDPNDHAVMKGWTLMRLLGAAGSETFEATLVTAWGTWEIGTNDEPIAMLDVDGSPGEEVVVVRRASSALVGILGTTNGDLSQRRVLGTTANVGGFLVDASLSIDLRGDFDGDARGDLIVRRWLTPITLAPTRIVELGVWLGRADGTFQLGNDWTVPTAVGPWALRVDDVPVAAGRLSPGTRDAFVLSR